MRATSWLHQFNLLLSHGTDAREKGQDWPELIDAAIGGHAVVVCLLLNKGAAASDGALTVASQTGHLEVVKLLLRYRNTAKQPPGNEPNALHMAARFGHVEVAELLLQRGADTEGGSAISVPFRSVLCCAVLCCAVLCCAVLCCAVLGWAGLDWTGLGWTGLGWAGLGCAELFLSSSRAVVCCVQWAMLSSSNLRHALQNILVTLSNNKTEEEQELRSGL